MNKEKEGRTDKVMKKKKKKRRKRERKVERKRDCQGIFVTASMPVSVKKKKKKKKRISKLWILGRKESFRSLFFVDLKKKKRLEANAIPSHTTPGRGKNSSGQEKRKERRKEKWWKWAEISKEERQRLEGGCLTDSFRTILFYIFGN